MFISFYLLAYLLASINSAIIVCFFLKLPSPRNSGSKNPGTTNVLRLSNKKVAGITLLGDILKGFIPIMIAHIYNLTLIDISYIGLASIIGHIFPIFYKFKGGKAVATLVGIMFGFNWIFGTLFVIIWLIIIFNNPLFFASSNIIYNYNFFNYNL